MPPWDNSNYYIFSYEMNSRHFIIPVRLTSGADFTRAPF